MGDKSTAELGEVVLVGAGPGDALLFTLEARRALRNADVILHDRLASWGLKILRDHERLDEARLIDVGKATDGRGWEQGAINALMIEKAREGKSVARLKGGDPLIFGRGAEEFRACQEAGIHCTVIPGLTSATAAATMAGIPLTLRGVAATFHVTTGQLGETPGNSETRWQEVAKWEGTLVVMMVVSVTGKICKGLVEGGRDPQTPCAFIERASLPTFRVTVSTLSEMSMRASELGIRAPAVLIVGEVVNHRLVDKTKPLQGVRILASIAGMGGMGFGKAVQQLRNLGTSFQSGSLFKYEKRSLDETEVAKLLQAFHEAEAVLVTSPIAAEHFASLLDRNGVNLRGLGDATLVTHGWSVAERLRPLGPIEMRTPTAGEGIRAAQEHFRGKNVLWLSGDSVSQATEEALAALNAAVDRVELYERKPVERWRQWFRWRLEQRQADIVIWGSAGGVEYGLGDLSSEARANLCGEVLHAAIGPSTAKALEHLGQTAHIMPAEPSYEKLAEAIRDHFARAQDTGE